ncbi:MAG: hypothetical protein ACAI34_25635 [Verrucomicrobium sp.]
MNIAARGQEKPSPPPPPFNANVAITKANESLATISSLGGQSKEHQEVRELHVLRLARIVVSLGTFSPKSPETVSFLETLKTSDQMKTLRAPDWVCFPDEYSDSLQRIGIAFDQFPGSESDLSILYGTQSGRFLSHLAIDALERVSVRTSDARGK